MSEKQPTKKVSAIIPETLWKEFRISVLRQRRTVNETLHRLIEEYVNQQKKFRTPNIG